MIIDEIESNWIHIVPTKDKKLPKGWKEHGGKWLIFRKYEELKSLVYELDSHIENFHILQAKFSREPTFYDTPVMCVYCLDSNKEETWLILRELGIQKRIWKYDKQTLEDWKPGGRLYQKLNKK